MPDFLDLNAQTLAGIAVMAAVTFGLKLAGYYTQQLVAPGPRLTRFLNALPGTVILSLTVPLAISSGIAGLVGLAAGFVLMARTGNILMSTAVGFVIAFAARLLTGL